MLTVHAAYPILCTFLGRALQPGDFSKISSLMLASIILILISQALFIASFFNLDSGIIFRLFVRALDDDRAVVDSGADYLLFTLPSVSSLLFLAPWLLVRLALQKDSRPTIAALFLLCIIALVLAARRAAILSVAMGVLFSLFAVSVTTRSQTRFPTILKGLALAITGLTAIVYTGTVLGVINIDLVQERITSIFDFTDNSSNFTRRLQFAALADGIAEHPFVGSGLGAATRYISSDSQPWAYELSYVALFFQFGALGFSFFVAGILYLIKRLVDLSARTTSGFVNQTTVACFLAGFVSFLIANATNPYLAKFDYMWVIFLPVAFLRLVDTPMAGDSSYGANKGPIYSSKKPAFP